MAHTRSLVRWEVPPQRRLAFLAVLALLAASVLVTLVAGFRPGGYLLAATLAAAALMRALLPPELCLGLLVRSRRVDVVVAAVLAVALALLAHEVPG